MKPFAHKKGSADVVESAIEVATDATKVRKTPTYKLRPIWEKCTGEVHHGLAEEFKGWFSERDIDANSGEYFLTFLRMCID